MLPPNKLGWMAGVIDLKGVWLRKRNQQRATVQIVLAVESRHMGIIRELGGLTGTAPAFKKAQPLADFMRKGCTEHCPEAHIHINEYMRDGATLPATARWTITGAGAAIILHNLMPFFMIDKDYQEIYQELLDATVLTGQGRGMVISAIRRLHSLGWDLPPVYEVALQDHEDRREAILHAPEETQA